MTTPLPIRSNPLVANRRLIGSRWGRCLLAWLSCVSILQLPVPVLHRHTEFESVVVIAEHLKTLHQQSAPPVELSHWHFLMPREINHEHDCDKDKPTTETVIACLGGVGSPSAGSDSLSASKSTILPMGVQVASMLTTLAEIAPQQTHPLASLRPTVRACAILCVVRC